MNQGISTGACVTSEGSSASLRPVPSNRRDSWFLVRAKPGGEEIAKANLERQGYRVYYPRLLCPTLYRGRWIDHIASLFPRYLFVQVDCEGA